jgi:hypothetical protein
MRKLIPKFDRWVSGVANSRQVKFLAMWPALLGSIDRSRAASFIASSDQE